MSNMSGQYSSPWLSSFLRIEFFPGASFGVGESESGETNNDSQSQREASQPNTQFKTNLVQKKAWALDPVFDTEEDRDRYLKAIGYIDTRVTREDIELEVGVEDFTVRSCDCFQCSDKDPECLLKVSTNQDYLCCNQRFPTWRQDLCDSSDGVINCVTLSSAYNACTIVHAVRGLLGSLKSNPLVNVKIFNPPSKENMRYGSYRAVSYMLRQRDRAPLSACIVADIRDKYPNLDGHYTGYVATNT